jgi:hypothetical protein
MKAIRLLSGKFFSVLFPLFLAVILVGCGSLPGPPPPAFSGNTNVTVLLSSTANDQLSEFDVSLASLSLTNKAGNTINLFQTTQSQTPHNVEYIHVNGGIEPLLTVSVPQGVYTAATASIGNATFTCETIDASSGNIDISTFAYGQTPSNQVTVNLPAPVTITGTAMGLSLNMLVFKVCELSQHLCYEWYRTVFYKSNIQSDARNVVAAIGQRSRRIKFTRRGFFGYRS